MRKLQTNLECNVTVTFKMKTHNIALSDVGMRGIWFDALDDTTPPLLWRQRFPTNIAVALVTASNPTGTLFISDLELTNVIAHTDVLAQDRNVRERTLWLASDNRPAVAWVTKGSATSLAACSHLLRFNALH